MRVKDQQPFCRDCGAERADHDEDGDCPPSPRCLRWGRDADRCLKHEGHTGPCVDQFGTTTLSALAKIVERSK